MIHYEFIYINFKDKAKQYIVQRHMHICCNYKEQIINKNVGIGVDFHEDGRYNDGSTQGFPSLGIVLILKLGDSYIGEHFIIFTLNCTYTLNILLKCLIALKIEKLKTKKQCLCGQAAWIQILTPPLKSEVALGKLL